MKAKISEKTKTIIVVSGLPRSGTSMMMKMLAEGGLPILTDSIRGMDEDNPNGYFEFEIVKHLADGNTKWLADADWKVVKIISQLLEYLPAEHKYKVIFMERDIKEVLISQRKMLERRSEEHQVDDTEMEKQFADHLGKVKFWLARQPNMEALYMNYNQLISIPSSSMMAIQDFIGKPLDIEKMKAVPTRDLYRNRVPKA
jgi:hypothetical protein